MNWTELLKQTGGEKLVDELDLACLFQGDQSPGQEDRAVAWELYVELRTRISTQPLHFLDGDEAAALTSLYNLFQLIRDLLKKHGADCQHTAGLTVAMLNEVIRPFTAKWHRRKLAGDLARDDACREFRGELQAIQQKLGLFEKLLYGIACGEGPSVGKDSAPDAKNVDLGPTIPFDELLGLKPPMAGVAAVEEIVRNERKEMEDRREAVGLEPGSDDLVGMAVSGGGIRSATFALGVVQGLAARGILRQVDVLSTVSGGGYLGSFLSSMLNTESTECGPQPDRAPFKPDIAGDSTAIRFLRNHSRFILPSNFPRWLRTVGQAAYGVVSNLIILSTIVFMLALLTDVFMKTTLQTLQSEVTSGPTAGLESSTVAVELPNAGKPDAEPNTAESDQELRKLLSSFWLPTKVLWGVSLLALFLLPGSQRLGRLGRRWAGWRTGFEWFTVGIFATSLGVTAIDCLPLAHFGYLTAIHAIGEKFYKQTDGWSMTATCFALVNAAGLIAARSQWLYKLGQSMPRFGKLLFTVLWMAGPALLVFAYFELCRVYVATPTVVALRIEALNFELSASGLLLLQLLIGSVVYSALTNVNFTSLHRYYRNRLAETYLLRRQNDGTVRSTEQRPRSQQLLSQLRKKSQSTAPYHLINAALNLPSSKVDELRGRDCDFFLFSKHHCGSPVLGYRPTEHWEAADAHLDLGTAVAISGAAAAPQMGMGSIKGASFLLTLLNVRLGYWLHQPLPSGSRNRLLQALSAPGPDYLVREAFNRMNHRSRYLNVSDGGHIENLGLYELLRRRCRYIIVIDGECDPDLVFPSLMRLQQFAAVDMNVRINVNLDRLRWVEFPPLSDKQEKENGDSAEPCPVPDRTRYSRGHYAVGRIEYPGNARGWLIYVKLSVTGNEPDYVLDYRRRHPEFPHESTADQMFEEDQFEAYRRLGEHITADLFSDELLTEQARLQATRCQLSVRDWYQEIVNCFVRQTGPASQTTKPPAKGPPTDPASAAGDGTSPNKSSSQASEVE